MTVGVEVLHPDAAVATVAARQHGVVTRAQLVAAGLGRRGIEWRVKTRRLHSLYRGVYLVGHGVPPQLAREMGAVLACGDGAVLSHRSAAALWRLPITPSKAAVDVTVIAKMRAKRAGISVHRTREVETTRHHAIPVTTPARTLLDLAEAGPSRELERAFDEALVQNLVRTSQIATILERHPHRRGAATLKALLAREHGPTMTRSEAEELMLGIVRAARFPHPALNAKVAGREVDLLFREHGVAVEVDSYGFHGRTRNRFEDDHTKTAELEAAGLTVIRVTYRQLTHDRDATVARLARALARAGQTASG